jgi:hypothetical protein
MPQRHRVLISQLHEDRAFTIRTGKHVPGSGNKKDYFAATASRSKKRRPTCDAYQCRRPRGVLTPGALSAVAMPFRLVTQAACSSAIMGARSRQLAPLRGLCGFLRRLGERQPMSSARLAQSRFPLPCGVALNPWNLPIAWAMVRFISRAPPDQPSDQQLKIALLHCVYSALQYRSY